MIYGQRITLYTDHKPLLGLLGEHKALPEHASARMQRWAITLAGYNYQLKHRPGKKNNADALSRLPIESRTSNYVPEELDALFNLIDKLPVSAEQISKETQLDSVLKTVYHFTMNGWPEKVNEVFKPYKVRQNELSTENECLLWGTRVIIPQTLQGDVLKLLHETHVGVARMKAQAREWLWWHQIDSDIEKMVKTCYQCQVHAKQPGKAPLHPWDWPSEAWERIHMDFAGPFMGKMFLLIVDAHSKWMDVKIMTKITASDTILELRDVFASMGLPRAIVTDNGPTFTSDEFRNFVSANGVKHITVSPYHPSSNGLAERAVQTFKGAMVKLPKGCLREKVCRFLTKYRSIPHSTTGVSPAELIFGRKIRTHLDLLHPTLHDKVQKQQLSQKSNFDKSTMSRDIGVEDTVFVRNYDRNASRYDKWVPGVITERTGPLSYEVRTPSQGVVRRHQDQIRVTSCDLRPYLDEDRLEDSNTGVTPDSNTGVTPDLPLHGEGGNESNVQEFDSNNVSTESMTAVTSPATASTTIDTTERVEVEHTQPRRSGRHIKPPDRLNL